MKLEGLTEVNPVHIDDREGRNNTNYNFRRVAVEDWDGECDIPKVGTHKMQDGKFMWQYDGKPAVYIAEDAVYVSQDELGAEAHRQAYYALNWLESQGLVEGWSKL